MKRIIKNVILLMLVCFMSSCATMFVSKQQNVTVSSKNPETTVYVDNEKATKGKQQETMKVTRGGAQIVLSTPGYKDEYIVMNPSKGKRAAAFYPLQILNVPATIFCLTYLAPYAPWVIDFSSAKVTSYEKKQAFVPSLPRQVRAEDEKYIDLEGLKFDIKNLQKDFVEINVPYDANMKTAFANAERKSQTQRDKADQKAAKKKKKEKYKEPDNNLVGIDVRISSEMFDVFKKTGYVDTITNIFADMNNTVRIEGKVKNIKYYRISGLINGYQKAKTDIQWNIKDLYGQTIDSLTISSFSGDFAVSYLTENHSDEWAYVVVKDAIENNLLDLKKNKTFEKYAKLETGISISDPLLTLTRPKNVVKNMQDAGDATVIVKRKNDTRHGSGFAITNDGYILTNYHVIAGKAAGKPTEVSIVTATGLEIPATVVRFNEKTDLALLKVDRKFEKAFVLNDQKKYSRHDECFTIGAPASIELGQSLANGLISNERETKEKMYLQLNMSVSPGNSGGAVFGRNGNLYGVMVSKLIGRYAEGICFAIPSHLSGGYLNIAYK